jgi:hypothetical protein
MEEGMGMPRGGNATSDANGPSLGRGMGVGSNFDKATSNGQLSLRTAAEQTARHAMPDMQMQVEKADVSEDANSVPGFPQDAFMEGPAMAMDEMFEKPETYGLRPGWSGFMQGMMTLLRVLPPDHYNHIVELRKKQGNKNSDGMSGMHEHMNK